MRVAVVGGGIHGLSAARWLAEAGHAVTVFEQFAPFHAQGSSHGRSRIVRRAYPDAFYTEIMGEAYPLWAELERASGMPLLHEPGLLYFGREDSSEIQSVLGSLRDLKVPHRIEPAHPVLNLCRGEIGIFTPEAGWVHAECACRATWSVAARLGATWENRRVEREELERDFDAFVVCAGPWIREWVDLPVVVSRQTVAYLTGEIPGPVWIEDGPDFLYGFPSEPGARTFKVAVHRTGPIVEPTSEGHPDSEALRLIREVVTRRFGIAEPEVTETVTCLYTNTADEDFLWGRLGNRGFYASPCSGHGFKFGPWIGQRLAAFVAEKAQPEDWPRFAKAKA